MLVIVEYIRSNVMRVINPKERPVKPKPKVVSLLGSVNRGPVPKWKDSTGCEYRSWKRQEKHARKNWMRHPHRIVNTGGARILNERGLCVFQWGGGNY